MASATSFGTRLLAAVLGMLLAFAWAGPADAQSAVDLQISPAIAGNTGVRAPQQVLVTGTAPAGSVSAARLIAVDVEGNRDFQDISAEVLNRTPAPVGDTADYLRSADGTVSGRLTLGCLFFHSTDGCPHADTRQVILELTTADQTGESNALRVDYTRPQLRLERELIAPDQVLVRFTEPVQQPQPEIGPDWRVDGVLGSVISVEVATAPGKPDCIYEPGDDTSAGTTGCARILHLSEPQHEDATPNVEYWLVGHMVPDRDEHHDLAGNQIQFSSALPEVWPALDFIRPAAPTIQSIEGKAPTGEQAEVLGSSTSPTVSLINVLAGHTIQLTVDGDASAPKTISKVVPPGANALDIQLSGLVDGGYNLSAVAIDPHGNRSDNETLQTARTDGIPAARYLLDTQAPRLLAAASVNRRTVLASFSEAILPAGNAGTWTVAGMNVTAEGSGHTRRLVSPVDLPNGGVVEWTPAPEAAPGSVGRYGDAAGNGMAAIGGIELDTLPAVPAPTVTQPTGTRYVNTGSTLIKGTAPSGTDFVAELFNTSAEEPIAEAPVTNRAWSFNHALAADGRYSYQVRLRNTKTGVVSQRVRVPDIVRDTAAPVVNVTAPVLEHSVDNPTGRKRLGVGDPVTITWTATDAAAGDTVRPDHGEHATILLVDEAGTARAVKTGIDHQAGQQQSYTYTLKAGDLANTAQRVVHFDVVVADLAKNTGTDSSAEVLLLADRVGYQPVLTKAATPGSPGVIEARFPVALEGETTALDWLIDGVPAAQSVEKQESSTGATVVRLAVALNNDPNAQPMVQYRAPAPELNQAALRAENGNWVNDSPRRTLDRVIPTLSVVRPATPAVIDAKTVTFTGTTDTTAFPNGIAAYASDASGARFGKSLARGTAGTNGQWSLKVPLTPNARNRIVLQAYDPSGNRSATRPSDPYTVVEDSVAPVVALRTPRSGATLGPTTYIRWSTVERHKKAVRLDYRGADGTWRAIRTSTPDDGRYKWAIPTSLRRQDFAVRIRAFDVTGKRGTHIRRGMHVDFKRPVITSAKAISPSRVRLYFSEPVRMSKTGFRVDGIRVARIEGTRARRTLVLRDTLDRTTPKLVYKGTAVTDIVGNRLLATELRASRGFVFPVTRFDADRRSGSRVALTWRDVRNRPAHIRGYRVYRDGVRIARLRWSARSFVDTRGSGSHRYAVQVVDDRGRLSALRRDRVR